MIVRQVCEADRDAVRAVHDAAFARADSGTTVESRLVDELYADGSVIAALDLVAEDDAGAVVGHVVCSRAWIGGTDSLGLGPLGVRPDQQRRGVGSALVHAVLGAADALGEPSVVLLGHADYYPRFGFVPAVPLGVLPPEPQWEPHFQLRRLTAWQPVRGPFRYSPAFDHL